MPPRITNFTHNLNQISKLNNPWWIVSLSCFSCPRNDGGDHLTLIAPTAACLKSAPSSRSGLYCSGLGTETLHQDGSDGRGDMANLWPGGTGTGGTSNVLGGSHPRLPAITTSWISRINNSRYRSNYSYKDSLKILEKLALYSIPGKSINSTRPVRNTRLWEVILHYLFRPNDG